MNGGYYYTPHLVKRIYAEDGYEAFKADNVVKNRTVSEKASEILAGMLEGVVKDGSGKKAYIEGYNIGGKTGTAQKYENGRIAAGSTFRLSSAFFPRIRRNISRW